MTTNDTKKEQAWKNLQELAERIGYGEITLKIQNGTPVRAEQVVKSIKLDQPDQDDELKTLQL